MSVLDTVREAAAQGITAALATCESQLSVPARESERWRLRSLLRCFYALDSAEAGADRAALWREAVRLAGGHLPVSLGRQGLRPEEQELLRRFGLRLGGFKSKPALLLESRTEQAPFVTEIDEALKLDAALRQPYPQATPDALLLRFSRYTLYRTPTQKAAIRALTTMPSGASLLVTMPTGAGKSLLFEIAPPWWQAAQEGNARACAIVIVPTVALALAHANAFCAQDGLEGSAALVSQTMTEHRRNLLDAFRRGEVPLLFISPEMAMSQEVRTILLEAASPVVDKPHGLNARLMGVFIDEAHIIESWGRSFRPNFQRLPGLVSMLRKANPELRTVLLSATVGELARNEIIRAYHAEGPFLAVDARVPRYELDLVTQSYPNVQDRKRQILELADRMPRPALIYTTLVADAVGLRDALIERGYRRVAVFTGQLDSAGERTRIIDDWLKDRIDIVVATSAFGMGIDKRDVRAVVHGCIPESPARYYQEIGRAARDGHQGLAVMLRVENGGSEDDWRLAHRQATSDWLGPELIASRWRALLWDAQRRNASSLDPITGEPRLALSLDAAHYELGPYPGDRNRLWNMSLINLLQRAGMLMVDVVDETHEVPVWHAVVTASWLLDAPAEGEPCWEPVIRLRNTEQKAAKADLEQFRRLVDGREPECLLTGTFELVEAGVNMVEPCGRCRFCREHDFVPPREVAFSGLDAQWSQPCLTRPHVFSQGISVVHPQDAYFTEGLAGLVDRLTTAGIEQFVAPVDVVTSLPDLLKESPCRFGFVLELDALERLGSSLAYLPTAVLVPAEHEHPRRLLQRLQSLQKLAPERSVVMVVTPDLRVEGRSLAQVASSRAPIREHALEKLANQLAS